MPKVTEVETGLWLGNPIKFEKPILYEKPVMLQRGVYSVGRIGAFSYVNDNFFSQNVKSIGRYCSIAPNVILGHYAHPTNALSHHNVFYGVGTWMDDWHKYENTVLDSRDLLKRNEPIELGNDVWIGVNCLVLNGVKIGHGVICGGGSIITSDVPPYAVVAGNPARIIRYRYDKETIKRLLKLEWWKYGPEILSNLDLTDIKICIKKIQERIDRGFALYNGNEMQYTQ